MNRRPPRLLIALLVTICVLLGSVAPAWAGTLTGASFTAPVGFTSTGAKNTRYDWGFTTATTATLSKVTASVPSGTGGANRYLALNGTNNNHASTPDSVANSITDEIDIRAKVTANDWTPSAYQSIVNKRGGLGESYQLRLETGGDLSLSWSSNNSTIKWAESAVLGFADGSTNWVRVTLDPDNGAGGATANFYKSNDGATWTTVGLAYIDSVAGPIYDGTTPVFVGSYGSGSTLAGRVYYAEIRNGINGTIANRFDPNEAAAQTPSSWASSSGETWTINRNGTNLPADIATDLSVGPVEGLPSGGTANYRFVDGVATYNLPVATSVPASTPVKLNLGGFTNTATAGNYTSLIRTYDNTGPPPAVVDNATTGALAFVGAESTTAASAVVDPTLTFSVTGITWTCGGVTPTAGTSSSGTSVSLGRLSTSQTSMASQEVAGSTNAASGFVVYARSSGLLQSAGGHSIASGLPVGWLNAQSFPAVGNEGFGIRAHWWNPDTWAQMSTSNQGDLLGPTGTPGPASACISYRAQAGSVTPAGSYAAAVTYTAVATY